MSLTQIEKEFENPSAKYRGKPFWAWNAKLEGPELRRQIRIFKEMGFGGFFMHSRIGLKIALMKRVRLVRRHGFMTKIAGLRVPQADLPLKTRNIELNFWHYQDIKIPRNSAGLTLRIILFMPLPLKTT